MDKLFRLAGRPELDAHHEAATAAFWGHWLDGCTEPEARAIVGVESVQAAYTCWALFDLPTPDGRTLAERLLAGEGEPPTEAERAWLERLRDSHLTLYEVTDVRAGQGFTLRDLWRDAALDVREHAASRQLARWDLLAARIVREAGDAPFVMEGGAYPLPAGAKRPILQALRRARRDFGRRVPAADDRLFFKRHAYRFNHFWLEHVALRPPPRLVTPEGDAVALARAFFEVRDAGAARARLAACRELVDDGDGTCRWLEPTDAGQRVLGTIRLEGRRLTVEGLSAARVARARALLEAALGDAVAYRATRHAGGARPRPAPDRQPVPPPLGASGVPVDVEARLIRDFKEQHYRDWLDRPLPALNGRTPREAARHPAGRRRLVEVLKWMENQEARATAGGRPAYDFGWMWRELGLDPTR
jgi:hypothetical protein